MNKAKKLLATTIVILGAGEVQAALPSSPILNYTSGTNVCLIGGTYPTCVYGLATVKNGSYFAMDLNNIGTFDPGERIATVSAGTGITLGTAQVAGAIDIDWSFASSNGRHLTQNPLTFAATGSANIYDVDMSGWTVNWGAEGDIDMGNGTDAVLTCDTNCSIGENFTLLYTATVPTGAFTGVSYQLFLTGVIEQDIPPISPPTVNLDIPNGLVHECSSIGGSNIPMNADITLSDGDVLNTIEWMIDGQFVSNQQNINELLELGTHNVSLTVNTQAGHVATQSTNVTIQDTVPPIVSAVFTNRFTGIPIDTLQMFQNFVGIEIDVNDLCDPLAHENFAMYGTPTADGGFFMPYGFDGGLIIPQSQLILFVEAEDAVGNKSQTYNVLSAPPSSY